MSKSVQITFILFFAIALPAFSQMKFQGVHSAFQRPAERSLIIHDQLALNSPQFLISQSCNVTKLLDNAEERWGDAEEDMRWEGIMWMAGTGAVVGAIYGLAKKEEVFSWTGVGLLGGLVWGALTM